jgi:hypothetical protein
MSDLDLFLAIGDRCIPAGHLLHILNAPYLESTSRNDTASTRVAQARLHWLRQRIGYRKGLRTTRRPR